MNDDRLGMVGQDAQAQTEERAAHPRVRRWLHRWWLLGSLAVVLASTGVFILVLLLGCPSVDHLIRRNPKTTAMIELRKKQGRIPRRFAPLTRSWVPLRQIPELLQRTVIVAEDCSFFQHEGVDWYEVEQAVRENVKRGRVARGASTISQQLAKNLFLSEERSLWRKLREWVLVGRLEETLSKHRILELYLNCIEYGRGVFGIGMASRRFFGKRPEQLTPAEMVRLAAVIPEPLRLSPSRPRPRLERRARVILKRLLRFGDISEPEFQSTGRALDAFFGRGSTLPVAAPADDQPAAATDRPGGR